ncbi:MAG: helix-turn-helix domain-containing protein [Desulfobacterales bacterium]|nr:helix-turn-helix domain-containing protein [Desulfobacterales bacterium]
MPERNSNITFGNYLKSKREEAGLDLESIFMETRISKKLLESIENEDHAKLPEPVYVKGFIRAYAKFIGADVDRVMDNYAESRRKYIDTAQPKMEITTKSVKTISDFQPYFVLGTVVTVIIIAIVVLAVYFYQDRSPSESVEPAKQAEKILHPKDDLSTTIKSSDQTG